jgi:hypothetical protein
MSSYQNIDNRTIIVVLAVIVVISLTVMDQTVPADSQENYIVYSYPQYCGSCGELGKYNCNKCTNCGYCYTPNGGGECVPGDADGPFFREDCVAYEYNDPNYRVGRVYPDTYYWNDPYYISGYYGSSSYGRRYPRKNWKHPHYKPSDHKQPSIDLNGYHKIDRSRGRMGGSVGSVGSGRSVGSRSVGSRSVGSRSVGSRSVGSRSVGSRSVGSRSVGSRSGGSRSGGSRSGGSGRSGR